MTNHPLNDDRLHKEFNGYYPKDLKDILDGSFSIFEAVDMRKAADWQLEQDQKELEDFLEEFLCRGHGGEANSDLRAFVNNFQSIMRPQQQEDS